MASSGMGETEFRATLPTSFVCKCGSVADGLDWRVARFDRTEWMGVCVASCRTCPWVHVAAAGTSDAAHEDAQRLRSLLLRTVGK